MRVQALPGALGAELLDLDLARDRSVETLRALVSALYRFQLVVVPRQTLTLSEFDEITRAFGAQRPHFLDHLRMDGHASILMLSNVFQDGRQLGIYEGARFWHTDVAYEDPPNSATVVYSIKAPKGGGAPTTVADMYGAYEALPEAMQRRIDDLVAIHHYGNRDDMVEGSPTAAETLTSDQKKRVSSVHQPLVRRHPVTGRRALYGVAGSSFGIVGMPDDEAIALLDELKVHATQPKFTTSYDYGPGDIACWDTYSTLHMGPAQKPAQMDDEHARMLWRVSVTGHSPLLEPHADAAAAQDGAAA